MSTCNPLALLAALGVLGLTLPAAAVDTSEWKCESCPYPKGTSGTLDAGVGTVGDASSKFGDYTGLQKKGGYLALGGNLSYRGDAGYWADLAATDLGLDTRSLAARSGREGLYAFDLAYSELPRHFGDGAVPPFLGVGGAVLTLPAGYPVASSAAAGGLQPVALGFERKRLDLSGRWVGMEHWTYRVALRRDTREGTRAASGTFFSTVAQLAAPVDHVTDQLEVSAAYATRTLQGQLAWTLSQFRNDQQSLGWTSPFGAVVPGATRAQLALAPDNQLQQLSGQAGWQVTPMIRASGDFSIGRLTQNEPYLASTLTPSLAATIAALPPVPAALDGHVDLYNGSLRVTATPLANLRLNASYARDERRNNTGSASYPEVVTDLYIPAAARRNTPFGIVQERWKIGADYRGPAGLRLAFGVDEDQRQRSYTEVVNTRETTVWGRVRARPLEELWLVFKAAHAERRHSDYGVATWFNSQENPLLRKFNLAKRKRASAGVRGDYAVSDSVNVGLGADYVDDDYGESLVGLARARSANLAADLAVAFGEQTQLTLFAQGERVDSRQAGSQAFAAPDWSARTRDRFEVFGLTLKHAAIPDKLDIGAELSTSRARSEVTMATLAADPQFPDAKTAQDSVRLWASYKLQDNLSLTGQLRYESLTTQDWRLDGVLPGTIANLLAFGTQAPRYHLGVLQLGLRYRF